jgi:hypothetical protein
VWTLNVALASAQCAPCGNCAAIIQFPFIKGEIDGSLGTEAEISRRGCRNLASEPSGACPKGHDGCVLLVAEPDERRGFFGPRIGGIAMPHKSNDFFGNLTRGTAVWIIRVIVFPVAVIAAVAGGRNVAQIATQSTLETEALREKLLAMAESA